MFHTIVVGTDGSDNAEAAVRVVSELARTDSKVGVHVVAAFDPWTAAELRSIATEVPADVRDGLRVESVLDARLNRVRSLFDEADSRISFHAMEEEPSRAIINLAETHRADLIVVGSRGQGAIARALHGSVATKVVHGARCSVMVIKLHPPAE